MGSSRGLLAGGSRLGRRGGLLGGGSGSDLLGSSSSCLGRRGCSRRLGRSRRLRAGGRLVCNGSRCGAVAVGAVAGARARCFSRAAVAFITVKWSAQITASNERYILPAATSVFRSAAGGSEVGATSAVGGHRNGWAGGAASLSIGAVIGRGINGSVALQSGQDMLDPGRVVFAADDILHSIGGFPKGDSSKFGVGKVLLRKLVGLCWGDVIVGAVGCAGGSRQSDVHPRVWVMEFDGSPAAVGNVDGACTVDVVDTCSCGAGWSVVELDKHEIEPNVLCKASKVCVGDYALWCSRKKIVLLALWEEVTLERLDHLCVSSCLVIGDSLAVECWSRRDGALNVKVETVDDCGTERAGFSSLGPGCSDGSKCSP